MPEAGKGTWLVADGLRTVGIWIEPRKCDATAGTGGGSAGSKVLPGKVRE